MAAPAADPGQRSGVTTPAFVSQTALSFLPLLLPLA